MGGIAPNSDGLHVICTHKLCVNACIAAAINSFNNFSTKSCNSQEQLLPHLPIYPSIHKYLDFQCLILLSFSQTEKPDHIKKALTIKKHDHLFILFINFNYTLIAHASPTGVYPNTGAFTPSAGHVCTLQVILRQHTSDHCLSCVVFMIFSYREQCVSQSLWTWSL